MQFHTCSWSSVHVWSQYTSFFIFIALPFSSINLSAFPEEEKSVQTAIKLIEPARYQLRCLRPWQHILHWPCRTLAWCYLSKFNSGPAPTDPAAASLFMSGSDWNTHSCTRRPDFHAGESPPTVGQTQTWRIGRTVSICSCSHQPDSFFFPFCCFVCFHSFSFQISVISDYFICLFFFISLLSVGNHLGAMVHSRWAE